VLSDRFTKLRQFVESEMRMSHVYQPVMLVELLKNDGASTKTEIAQALLSYDASQIEYYEHITSNMVGRVLTRNRGLTSRDGQTYRLNGFGELHPHEVEALVQRCVEKIESFIEARGDQIWAHRRRSSRLIPGSIKYNVLSMAKGRCELCGIPKEERALEVDHILPRNHGGTNDPSNLQALCYQCNAMKRDTDDTDFRNMNEAYKRRLPGCEYCDAEYSDMVEKNILSTLTGRKDGVWVVAPRRHIASYFDLYRPELNAMNELMGVARRNLELQFPNYSNHAISIESSESDASQSFHCSMRLTPE